MTSCSNADTEITTELFVQLRQSAREAMPAAWAWCRVAVKINVMYDLSQIVLDFAGIEDTEVSASNRSRSVLLCARTTNGCLFRADNGFWMACHMPLVGVVRVTFWLADRTGTTQLSLAMEDAVNPTALRGVMSQIIEVAAPTIEWSCERRPGNARVKCLDTPAVIKFAPLPTRSPNSAQVFDVDHDKLRADLLADGFLAGTTRTASVLLVFSAWPGYLAALAPSRAQLRRQTAHSLDGQPGVWHRLLTAKAERTVKTDDWWALVGPVEPVRSIDPAPGLIVGTAACWSKIF